MNFTSWRWRISFPDQDQIVGQSDAITPSHSISTSSVFISLLIMHLRSGRIYMKQFQGALLLLAWLTAAINLLFSNRWSCNETWRCLLFARYPNFVYIDNTTVSALTQVIKNSYVEQFDITTSAKGVYYTIFIYPYPSRGKRRNVNYFYQDTNRICLAIPTAASDVSYMHIKSAQMVGRRLEISINKTNSEQKQEVEKQICDMVHQHIED